MSALSGILGLNFFPPFFLQVTFLLTTPFRKNGALLFSLFMCCMIYNSSCCTLVSARFFAYEIVVGFCN